MGSFDGEGGVRECDGDFVVEYFKEMQKMNVRRKRKEKKRI